MSAAANVPVGAAVTNSTEAKKLPESLGWYRDAGNWIVGMSVAAIGGGLAYLDKLIDSPLRAATAVFLLALLAFLFAVLFGVLFYFWIVSYGNQREEIAKLRAEAEENSGAKKDQLKPTIATAEDNAKKALSSVQRFHNLMLCFFFAGAALALLAGLLQILFAERPEGPWSVHTHTFSDAACQCSRFVVVRINNSSGVTWTLAEPSAGTFVWRAAEVEKAKDGPR